MTRSFHKKDPWVCDGDGMLDLLIRFPTKTKTALAFGLMASLAACGGGGSTTVGTEDASIPTPETTSTDTSVTEATPETPLTGEQMRSNALALVGDFDPIEYTALGSVPTTGEAVYNGYFYGGLANDTDDITDSVIGTMAMTVTFNATSVGVTGSVDDFADADDNAMSGSVTLSGGSLNRDGNPSNDATLLVQANGTLTDSADRALVLGAQLEGDFLGGAYTGVGGAALGSVTVDGVDQDFDGGFIGEK